MSTKLICPLKRGIFKGAGTLIKTRRPSQLPSEGSFCVVMHDSDPQDRPTLLAHWHARGGILDRLDADAFNEDLSSVPTPRGKSPLDCWLCSTCYGWCLMAWVALRGSVLPVTPPPPRSTLIFLFFFHTIFTLACCLKLRAAGFK